MNLGKKFRSAPKLLLLLLVVGGVLLASCSPQVVEVEKEVVVTQVVKEEVIGSKVVLPLVKDKLCPEVEVQLAELP